MDHNLATAEKDVLEDLVKLMHLRAPRGEHYESIDVLVIHEKDNITPLNHSLVSRDELVSFLTTSTKKEDLQALKFCANSLLVKKLKQESPENNTAEHMLIQLTMKSWAFWQAYCFYNLSDDWLVSDIGMKPSTVMNSTDMIAIDCEMVLCDDRSEGLVKFGAVNRYGKVILDHFVKPDKPIVDYRTAITGVTAHDIENASLSVADIQRELQPYLSNGAILVGHSLNNDMKMLEAEKTKLFIHMIPSDVSSEEVNTVLAGEFHSRNFKLDWKQAKRQRGYSCAVVVFDSSKEADQAFDNVNGLGNKDSYGLSQKVIALKLCSELSDSCYVRKMVQD